MRKTEACGETEIIHLWDAETGTKPTCYPGQFSAMKQKPHTAEGHPHSKPREKHCSGGGVEATPPASEVEPKKPSQFQNTRQFHSIYEKNRGRKHPLTPGAGQEFIL